MKLLKLFILSVSVLFLASCSDHIEQYDSYHDWQSRNESWFLQVADSARTAIEKAQALYGNEWESHCEWRRFKSLQLSTTTVGPVTDSVIVKIIPVKEEDRMPYSMVDVMEEDFGKYSPTPGDTVYIATRGRLMTRYDNIVEGGKQEAISTIFYQTYLGDYRKETAAWMETPVSGVVEGMATALQYMKSGDHWVMYIPQNLGYRDDNEKTGIPAYSTLCFSVRLIKWKRASIKGYL